MIVNFTLFNWFDYCLVAIIFLSLLLGIKRGFLREIISLMTWIAAFFVAIIFASDVTVYLSQYMKSEFLASLTSFLSLFIVTLIVGAIINYIVTRLVQKAGLTVADRLFGAVFGGCRGVMIVLFVVFLLSNTDLQNSTWYQKSQLTYSLQGASSWIQERAIEVAQTVNSDG
jgi:membrane protein required for colicin V production